MEGVIAEESIVICRQFITVYINIINLMINNLISIEKLQVYLY